MNGRFRLPEPAGAGRRHRKLRAGTAGPVFCAWQGPLLGLCLVVFWGVLSSFFFRFHGSNVCSRPSVA